MMSRLEFIRQAKAQGCKSKFIILTGYSDFEYTQKAIQMGVNSYLLKPVEEDELIQIVRELHDLIINEQEILNYVVSGRKHLKEAAIRDVLKGEASGSPIYIIVRKILFMFLTILNITFIINNVTYHQYIIIKLNITSCRAGYLDII